MKAVLYDKFGAAERLQWRDTLDPALGEGKVLVKVAAAALNPKDVLVRKGKFKAFTGTRMPRIPGYDLCGEVVALGLGADGFEVGQRVYGMIQRWSGGACAELAAVPDTQLAPWPQGLNAAEAASIPLASLTALQALRDMLRLRQGERVCINGASGGVGTMAVQIAHLMGAHVTGVCSHRNVERVAALGADEVIDYTQTTLSDSGLRFDAFFDVFGSQPWAQARQTLGAKGRFVTAIPAARSVGREVLGRLRLSRARLVIVQSRRADLELLKRWLEAGTLKPVVDRILPMSQSPEAHLHIETRRAKGKVVLIPDTHDEAMGLLKGRR